MGKTSSEPSSDDTPGDISAAEPELSPAEIEAKRKIEEHLRHAIDHLEEQSDPDSDDSPLSRFISSKNDLIGEHYRKQNDLIRQQRAKAKAASQPTTPATPNTPQPIRRPEPPLHAVTPEPTPISRDVHLVPRSPTPPVPPENGSPKSVSAPDLSKVYSQDHAREIAEFFQPGSPSSFAEALMRYGSPGAPEYDAAYDPDNPEYVNMSPRRRRSWIKKLMLEFNLVSPDLPGFKKKIRLDPDMKGSYIPGSRKGIGNSEGQKVNSKHPDGLNMAEAYVEIFQMNEGLQGHEKLQDDDIAFIISEMFQHQRPRTVKDVREARSLFNSGKLHGSGALPSERSRRYSRRFVDPKDPNKGYEVFLVSNKDGIIGCCSDENHPVNFPNKRPPQPPTYKRRAEFAFPANAPYWFKWWNGRIVTNEQFEQLKHAKDKADWEAAHPGESFDISPDEDLPEFEDEEIV